MGPKTTPESNSQTAGHLPPAGSEPEGVVAVVTARAGAVLDEKQMIAALGSELAKYKLPKRIFVADSLPRNAMGKIQKNQLREEHKGTFV